MIRDNVSCDLVEPGRERTFFGVEGTDSFQCFHKCDTGEVFSRARVMRFIVYKTVDFLRVAIIQKPELLQVSVFAIFDNARLIIRHMFTSILRNTHEKVTKRLKIWYTGIINLMAHSTRTRRSFAAYLRTFVFGVEDSLVSTVGLLSGIAAAGVSRTTILITGVVLVFVEALSMAVGELLSENSAEEYITQGDVPLKNSFDEGALMFVSYVVSGFIPLAPYLFLDNSYAFTTSIALSLVVLFVVGVVSGKVSKAHAVRNGIRMTLVGSLAIIAGVFIGSIAH